MANLIAVFTETEKRSYNYNLHVHCYRVFTVLTTDIDDALQNVTCSRELVPVPICSHLDIDDRRPSVACVKNYTM